MCGLKCYKDQVLHINYLSEYVYFIVSLTSDVSSHMKCGLVSKVPASVPLKVT